MTYSLPRQNDPIGIVRRALAEVDRARNEAISAYNQFIAPYHKRGLSPRPDDVELVRQTALDAFRKADVAVQAALAIAGHEAAAMASAARVAYDQSSEGLAFYQMVPAVAALTGGEGPDRLAARLNQALQDGNRPLARALAELAQKAPQTSPQLSAAITNAQAALVPDGVKQAEAIAGQLAVMRMKQDTAIYKRDALVQDIVQGKADSSADYPSSFIIGDNPSPSASMTVTTTSQN